jgi:hypothetical protein
VGCPQGTAGPPGLSVLGGRMEPGAGGHATRGLVGGVVFVTAGDGGGRRSAWCSRGGRAGLRLLGVSVVDHQQDGAVVVVHASVEVGLCAVEVDGVAWGEVGGGVGWAGFQCSSCHHEAFLDAW